MTLNELITGYHQGGGSLSGDALTRRAGEVWSLLLGDSRGRVTEVESGTAEGVLLQQCFDQMVAVAAETVPPELQSETLGQWSRTYRDGSGSGRQSRLRTLERQYLGETGLLYRGWPG